MPGKSGVGSRLEAHGISLQRRERVCSPTRLQSTHFTLLIGKFDLEKVREDLDDRGYEEGEYKGVEVWERETGWGSDARQSRWP